MDRDQRTAIMDAISRAGDDVVLEFGGYCMRLLESNGDVTVNDAETFASTRGLVTP